MVPHQWPVALVVIWQIYSCLACSWEDSGRDLPSSGKVVLGQGQVPWEFWADQPNFIFQPVDPDMIWHIYSHLYCSLRDSGRGCLPWRLQVPTINPWEAVQVWVNVENHVSSHLAEKWSLADLLETPRGPAPDQGPPSLKMVSLYHYPPRSRPGMSKCVKSQPEPLAIDEAPSSAGLGWKAP